LNDRVDLADRIHLDSVFRGLWCEVVCNGENPL
jgi:hypothetical protein